MPGVILCNHSYNLPYNPIFYYNSHCKGGEAEVWRGHSQVLGSRASSSLDTWVLCACRHCALACLHTLLFLSHPPLATPFTQIWDLGKVVSPGGDIPCLQWSGSHNSLNFVFTNLFLVYCRPCLNLSWAPLSK